LGTLVARLHDAGIRHNDLHPANILVRLDDDDQLSLFLIDLNAVRLGTPLAWTQSRQNLVILNRWFVLRASRCDRHRFWKAYCRQRQGGTAGAALWAEKTRPRADEGKSPTLASNLRFWKHREKRCLKDNHYYRRVRGGGVGGPAVVDLDEALLSALAAD